MGASLYEYERNVRFGAASQESINLYVEALKRGTPFFLYPYHGYHLKMVVRDERSPEEEQQFLNER